MAETQEGVVVVTPDSTEENIRLYTETMRKVHGNGLAELDFYGYGSSEGEYPVRFYNKELHEGLSASDMIASYVRTLIKKGQHPVRVVDFGAGEGLMFCKAALQLREEIKGGDTQLLATNLVAKPTLKDIESLPVDRRRQMQPLEQALRENLVEFTEADIFELRDKLAGEKIQLMFMVNMFGFTEQFNDALLAITADLLDKQHGTLVTGHRKMGKPLPGLDPWKMLNNGISTIKANGFQQKPDFPFQQESRLTFTLFQAPHAPQLEIAA